MYPSSSSDHINIWSDEITSAGSKWPPRTTINQDESHKLSYTVGTNFAALMVKVYGIVTDLSELKYILSRIFKDQEDGFDFMKKAEKYFNDHGIYMNALREDFVILSMESDSLSLTKEEKKKFRNIYPVMNPTRYFITVNYKKNSYP